MVRDIQGKVVREKMQQLFASRVQFLPSGNVVLLTRDFVHELNEVGQETRSTQSAQIERRDFLTQEVLGNGNLLVLSKEGNVFEWNRNTWKPEREIRLPQRIDVTSVKAITGASPHGYIAILQEVGNVWQLDTKGKKVKPWPLHDVNSAGLLRNGNLLASVGDRNAQRVVEIEGLGKRLWEAVPHYSGQLQFQSVLNVIRFGFQFPGDLSPDIDSITVRTQRLQSRDPAIRAFSASMLGRNDVGSKPFGKLVALLGDENVEVRREAFGALLFSADKAVDALAMATASPNDNLRANAIQLLGYCQRNSAIIVPNLIKALDDKNHLARRNAAFSLISFGSASKSAVPALMKALQDKAILPGTSESVCEGALQALEGIGRDADQAAPAIVAILDDSNRRLRAYASRALGTVGKDKDAVAALIKVLENDGDMYVHAAAAAALAKRGPAASEGVGILMRLLDSREQGGTMSAANRELNVIVALGRIGADAKPAIPRILAKLRNFNNSAGVREKAAEALGNIGVSSSEIDEALRMASDDINPEVQKASKASLSKLKVTTKSGR